MPSPVNGADRPATLGAPRNESSAMFAKATRMVNRAKGASARVYGGLSSDERRADRRCRLIETGFALFGTVGFPAVSIPDICSRAGVTARHFYEEFVSREALIKQIYDDISVVLFYRVRHALFEGEAVAGLVIRDGCAAYVEYLTSDVRRARVLCIEVAGISRHLDHHRLKMRRRFAQLILESSQRLRQVDFDPGVDLGIVSTLLTGAADALMSEWALSREPSVLALIDTLTAVWMRSLQLDRLEHAPATGAVLLPSAWPQLVAPPQPTINWPSLGLGNGRYLPARSPQAIERPKRKA